MNNFKKYNLIAGWFSFAFAAVVYLMTIEPTASLWDCAEFIATSYKLEVGHPPGAPLFMMISRLFAIFAPSPQSVAIMINSMSALASAATILFLFWSITHLARRALGKREEELTTAQTVAILGAGLVGAISYTFTDTFWFSAVEGEVYALSSMFTAVVFWAILQWENVADEPHANRWLVLIAYLTGLAVGVHLLNLLIIPAIVLIYYFRKYPVITNWGVVKALAVSAAILIAAMFIIIPGTVQLGAFFDRVFVNTLGLPINSGITCFALALMALVGWGVWYTHRLGKVLANTIILCVGVILIGYGSYASVIIRSAANPPMNSNNPSNAYGLLSLLNRDQYGARPLLKGPYYSSPAIAYQEKDTYYVGDDSTYAKASIITGLKYPPEFEFFFPRMYSSKESDIQAYHNWVDIKGKNLPYHEEMINVPTFAENLKFFFAYQLNFMCWRYFLWNFVGRQSDIQSTGEITDGNWLSGIKPIDAIFLGPQDDLPAEMANNKGRNTYYFLPFLLGIIGLLFQLNRDGKNFSVVMIFFIMTGVAIAVYLNSPPSEPRERDYVYAGSFYAFCIWIGFGVLALYQAFSRWFRKENVATALYATAICAVVPALLGAQNWDDHDRSHRYTVRDLGTNYLDVLPNAIVMNFGDNDTFPLWYAQEVEGVRTDVRVMNMSYLSGEWYIDQMKIRSNQSAPVPFSLPRSKYTYANEFVPVQELFKKPIPIAQAIDFLKSDDPRSKVSYGEKTLDFLPARQLIIPVNKENVLASGIVKAKDEALIPDSITITLPRSSVDRSEMMLLDLLAHFDWKRPLYFTGYETSTGVNLGDYLQMEGFTYLLTPIRTPAPNSLSAGRIDTESLYPKLMKYNYGNVKDPRVYADYFVQHTMSVSRARVQFNRLAGTLLEEGDTTKALQVLDRSLEELPFSQLRHNYFTLGTVEGYYRAGRYEKGNEIMADYASVLEESITYYLRFTGRHAEAVEDRVQNDIALLYELYKLAGKYRQDASAKSIQEFFVGQGLMEEAKS